MQLRSTPYTLRTEHPYKMSEVKDQLAAIERSLAIARGEEASNAQHPR
jgi:hypothetical protein